MLGKIPQLPGSLDNLLLEPLLVVSGALLGRRQLICHVVEGNAEDIELLETARRHTYGNVAFRKPGAWPPPVDALV